jgi:VWFA-related protein
MMFFIALFLIVIPGMGRAQQEQPLFRAGITLVKIDAQVTDPQGRPISGLRAEEFRIFDEGEPQNAVFFGHEAEPLDVLLLLDVSGSMRRLLEEMASNARAALKQLHENDRVGVMLFARYQRVEIELSDELGAAESGIRAATRKQDLGAGTSINESIVAAAKYMREQPARGRRAILMVTDNEGLNYQSPDEAAIRSLHAANVVLNALVSQPPRKDTLAGRETNPDFTPPDVYKLARETGGEAIEMRRAKNAFQEMIERIRSRYSLQYPAPMAPPGSFRRVRVELSPEARRRYSDASVHARAGYYALD